MKTGDQIEYKRHRQHRKVRGMIVCVTPALGETFIDVQVAHGIVTLRLSAAQMIRVLPKRGGPKC